jgi:DNA-binding MarR family transcriptional regulator
VLFRLDGHPRLDLSALAAALDVTPERLRALLAPLAGAGFVTITSSPQRSPLIAQLTPAGADAIERLVRARQQGLTRLLGSWSADLDAQLASRIQQLTRDILDDPARRHQLLAALAPTGTP